MSIASMLAVPNPTAPFALHLLTSSHPRAELARAVEREVFLEFFGNTPELLASEYDAYESSSLFVLVMDQRRDLPAGTMRVILPSPLGSKSLHDLASLWDVRDPVPSNGGLVPLDATRTWDIATLAVAEDYRGRERGGVVSLALYQALAMLLRHHEVESMVAILDLAVLDLLQTRLGRPFTRFHGVEPERYLDSPWSLPVYCDVADYMARLRFADGAIYEMVFEAKGLEAAVAFPSWDELFALPSLAAAV